MFVISSKLGLFLIFIYLFIYLQLQDTCNSSSLKTLIIIMKIHVSLVVTGYTNKTANVTP